MPIGVTWYPGGRDQTHEDELTNILRLGTVGEYTLQLEVVSSSNRPRVCVRHRTMWYETYARLNPIEIEEAYGGPAESLNAVRGILAEHEVRIQKAWDRLKDFTAAARNRWLATLEKSSDHLSA